MNELIKTEYDFSIKLDTNIYSLQAIKNTAYDFSGNAWITIKEPDNKNVMVSFKLKDSRPSGDPIDLEFMNNLLDHQVRLDLESQFKTIREMIVAQAFEPCENLDEVVNFLSHE